MTPLNSVIMSVPNSTAFIGADELLAPAAPAVAASSVYGAVGSACLGFFVVKHDFTGCFWSLCWRFQPGLCDDRIHRQQYQMNITLATHTDAFNNTSQQRQAGVSECITPRQGCTGVCLKDTAF